MNCFEPVAGDQPHILILGSMPSAKSLEKGEYYGHPQNRFWKILFRFFCAPYSADYNDKIRLLKDNHLALWDTIRSCERPGSSLDSNISRAEYNPVDAFLVSYPSVKAVFLNGSMARDIFASKFKQLAIDIVPLPSTSPANASYGFEKLCEIWCTALGNYFLGNLTDKHGL